LNDFVEYLKENGVIYGATIEKLFHNWKEGRSKDFLESYGTKSHPFKLHESRTGISSSLSLQCTNDDNYDCDCDDGEVWLVHKKIVRKRNPRQCSNSCHAADFEENVRLVISMQMNGCGGEDAVPWQYLECSTCLVGLACVTPTLWRLSKKLP
jgi:hypothetical protein